MGYPTRLRIIVLGYIVRGPLGGLVWHHLQYVMGLCRLGHDAYFIEDSDDYESCYEPATGRLTSDPQCGLSFASDLFDAVGLGRRWAYFDAHRNTWMGPAGASARGLLRSADLLLNLSGVNPMRDWFLDVPHRALVDTDPAFTQIRHHRYERKMRDALAHTAFFTFGENFGTERCSMPDDGLPWRPTRQPIVLDAWPVLPGNPEGNFSTVMQWNSYPALEFGGRCFGTKAHSFGPYLDLPRRTTERLELALGSLEQAVGLPAAPRDSLRDRGWIVTDALAVTRTASAYQEFICQSKAEFSVAKHGYESSRSGWFSERSAAYLASGRPVVTQDTGFTDWLTADGGVLPFDSPQSAADAIDRVSRNYATHCRLARGIAEDFFESGVVLSELLRQATGAVFRAGRI